MTDTYKVLGQIQTSADTNTVLYSVPSGAQASISSLAVTNTGSATEYTLSAVLESEYAALITPAYSEWSQIGSTLTSPTDSISSNEQYGADVAISQDGSVIAIGVPYAVTESNTSTRGAVYIYERNASSFSLRDVLEGSGTDLEFGFSIALNSDGSVLVVGAPQSVDGLNINAGYVHTYEWTGSAYVQLGSVLPYGGNNHQFGYSVDISSDAQRLVVGAYGYTEGSFPSGIGAVYAFKRNPASPDNWMLVSYVIGTEENNYGSHLGASVAISADGSVFVAGEPDYGEAATGAGNVRTFAWTESGISTLQNVLQYYALVYGLGQNPEGDQFGISIDLSSDGEYMIVGAKNANNEAGGATGSAYVFRFINNSWELVGDVITNFNPTQAYENVGSHVSISGDGQTIAVGAESMEAARGAVGVYDLVGGEWVIRDQFFRGPTEWAYQSPNALSQDGTIVIIGARTASVVNNNVSIPNAGSVKVHEWNTYPAVLNSPAAKSAIIKSKNIDDGQHHEIAGGIQLSEGDSLIISSSSSNLIASVFGVEIS